MSDYRKVDDSELAEVNGGSTSLSDVQQDQPDPPNLPQKPGTGGGGGGGIPPEEENPGGGLGHMEQSE